MVAIGLAVSMMAANIPVSAMGNQKSTLENNQTEGNYMIMVDEGNKLNITAEYRDSILNEYNNTLYEMELSQQEAINLDLSSDDIHVEENIELIALEEDITGLSDVLEDNNVKLSDLDESFDLEQWYLDAISFDKNTLDFISSRDKIKIELLDSGVSYTDDIDIAENVNLVPEEDDISILYVDATGHGTSLAGIIGAKDNDEGITGINPYADIYSVKVLDDENKATLSRVVEGIYWGIEHDVNIINMSFGTSINSSILHKAVSDAYDAGILLIAAAGNASSTSVLYPAAYPEVMAVGATGTDGLQMKKYADGEEIEILAPGDGILGTGLFDGIVVSSGTSVSAVQVTAAASILWAKDSSKPAVFIRELLKHTGRIVENVTYRDVKLLNIAKAEEEYDIFIADSTTDNNTENSTENDTPTEEYSEAFEDIIILNGLWASDKHVDIVEDYLYNSSNIGDSAYEYLNSNRVNIMAVTAKAADHEYKTEGSSIHGTGNYIQASKFLYECAQNVRSGDSVNVAITSAKAVLTDTSNATAVNNLINDTKKMLNDTTSGISSDQTNAAVRYFKVLGFALHSMQDTFAHRALVLEEDLSNFTSSHFNNWDNFKSLVKQGKIEYRDIDTYTSNHLTTAKSRALYEDNVNLRPTRLKDAKKGSAYLLKASLLKAKFSADWFRNPAYGTTMIGQTTYKE